MSSVPEMQPISIENYRINGLNLNLSLEDLYEGVTLVADSQAGEDQNG